MAPKPPSISPSPDSPGSASAEAAMAAEVEKRRLEGAAGPSSIPDARAAVTPPAGNGDQDELAVDDDEDEDLVVFTAKEAAGALATIYAFIKPFLKKYKKMLAFVGIGVVIETLFNVIMPLSLKFLIDDALGEED